MFSLHCKNYVLILKSRLTASSAVLLRVSLLHTLELATLQQSSRLLQREKLFNGNKVVIHA